MNSILCIYIKKKDNSFDSISYNESYTKESHEPTKKTPLTHIKREKLTRRKMIETIYMHDFDCASDVGRMCL